jgi:hypothetical protein
MHKRDWLSLSINLSQVGQNQNILMDNCERYSTLNANQKNVNMFNVFIKMKLVGLESFCYHILHTL